MQNLYTTLPESSGVYIMKDARGKILYIGKAGNLRRRVASYFQKTHLRKDFGGQAHDVRIEKLVSEIKKIDHKKTESVLEALILEAALIKKYSPLYNIREKDDTSFLYVVITKEEFPQVLLVRGKTLYKFQGTYFGPFVYATDIREALRIVRRVFPWHTHRNITHFPLQKPCFDYELGLCPGVCSGIMSRKEYVRHMKNIELFFSGKKKQLVHNLQKEMQRASNALEFEKAEKIKKQLFALHHIQDVALLHNTRDTVHNKTHQSTFRIEGYDISNISGEYAVGVMVVFHGTVPVKSEYRKFKIRNVRGPNDVGMLREVFIRRLSNSWPLPNLILIDGGKGQVNIIKKILIAYKLTIPVVGIAKGPERTRNDVYGIAPSLVTKETLVHVRNEAHRFAITYHRKIRWSFKK